MNIIIPLGGIGERFVKENYTEPKPSNGRNIYFFLFNI